MTVSNAFSMSLEVSKVGKRKGELLLNANFGRSRIDAHRIDALGVKLDRYYIDYGFTGGDLSFRLYNCRMPVKGRLTSGNLPLSTTEKIVTSTETAGSSTTTRKDAGSASMKDGLSLNAEDGEQTTTSDKSGATKEVNHIRALLHSSGPDDQPCWRFESEVTGECLSGKAPGSGRPPLALVTFDDFPTGIEASFSILANDVEVIDLNPAKFDKSWTPKKAVARRVLRSRLADTCTMRGGSVLVVTKRLGWSISDGG